MSIQSSHKPSLPEDGLTQEQRTELERFRLEVRKAHEKPSLFHILMSPIYVVMTLILIATGVMLIGGGLTMLFITVGLPFSIIAIQRWRRNKAQAKTSSSANSTQSIRDEQQIKLDIIKQEQARAVNLYGKTPTPERLSLCEGAMVLLWIIVLTPVIYDFIFDPSKPRSVMGLEKVFAQLGSVFIAFLMTLPFLLFQQTYLGKNFNQRWLSVSIAATIWLAIVFIK